MNSDREFIALRKRLEEDIKICASTHRSLEDEDSSSSSSRSILLRSYSSDSSEDKDEFKVVKVKSNIEENKKGFVNSMMSFFKCLGHTCWVICPPVPEYVTRKLAFIPPTKRMFYTLVAYDRNDNRIAEGDAQQLSRYPKVKIEPKAVLGEKQISLDNVETFILNPSKGSFIVAVLVRNVSRIQDEETSDLVVIFSQPNGSDLGRYLQSGASNLQWFAETLNADIYAYDYSGYGMSSGHVSEQNVYMNIAAVYDHVVKTRGPKTRIALLGYSLGTAATIAQAARHPPNLCGVILIAPFSSGLKIIADGNFDRTCCMDRFLNFQRAPEVNVPVLICHGEKDQVIPVSHGKALQSRFKYAMNPCFVRSADHHTIFSGKYIVVFYRIRRFLCSETFKK